MNIVNINNWNNKLDEMIVVGGSARSGTTIIGKILHSMKDVEYFFEPPLLTPILLKNNELKAESIKELIGFYLYDSLFLDALAGRNINLNRNDDSCIYNVKEDKEIRQRYEKSYSRIELETIVKNTTLSFKLPEIVFFLEDLKRLFPNLRLVLMHRNMNDVVNSIIKKKWFSDNFLNENHDSQIYATKIVKCTKIPYWVKEKDVDFWVHSDEINRCAYYFLQISASIYKNRSNAVIINYDTFIKHPEEKVQLLAKKYDLSITDKTKEIISAVKYQDKKRESYMDQIDDSLLQKIEKISKNLVQISI